MRACPYCPCGSKWCLLGTMKLFINGVNCVNLAGLASLSTTNLSCISQVMCFILQGITFKIDKLQAIKSKDTGRNVLALPPTVVTSSYRIKLSQRTFHVRDNLWLATSIADVVFGMIMTRGQAHLQQLLQY